MTILYKNSWTEFLAAILRGKFCTEAHTSEELKAWLDWLVKNDNLEAKRFKERMKSELGVNLPTYSKILEYYFAKGFQDVASSRSSNSSEAEHLGMWRNKNNVKIVCPKSTV